MKVPVLKSLLALLFYPKFVKRLSIEHHRFLKAETRRRLEEQRAGSGPLEEPWPERQVTLLRRSWMSAALSVGTVLVAGYLSARLLSSIHGPPSAVQTRSRSNSTPGFSAR